MQDQQVLGAHLPSDSAEHRCEIPAVGQWQVIDGIATVDEHCRSAFGPELLPELRLDQFDLIFKDVLRVGRAKAYEIGLGHAFFGGANLVQCKLHKPLLVGVDALDIKRRLLLLGSVHSRGFRLMRGVNTGHVQRGPKKDWQAAHRGYFRIHIQGD